MVLQSSLGTSTDSVYNVNELLNTINIPGYDELVE